MTETRFFDEGTIPEWTTPEWYAAIERAPHLEQDAHRPRLLKARDLVLDAFERGAWSVSDLGAGDGGLLSLLKPANRAMWGYDLIPENVEAARRDRDVDVTLVDFLAEDVRLGACVVLTEVLEHLRDPHALLAAYALPASTVEFVVASSPNNETWDSRYEFHAWGFDLGGYRAMFEDAGWHVLRHEAIPGFQLLLADRP